MITIEQALDIIKNNSFTLDSEHVDLGNSLDRVLARDLLAPEPSPRFDNSAMDGFAVLHQDVSEASSEFPVSLRIIGESQAGIPFQGKAENGSCIRISTGAVLPKDFDTVIRVEYTESAGNNILVHTAVKKGKDIRYQAEEYQTGDLLLEKHTRITARHIAILAAAGADTVTVYRKARVALLVTGSELTTVGEQPGPGQIRDSNRLMLDAAVSEAGGETVFTGRVVDDLDETIKAIKECSTDADLVICAGGVSVGPHDHVKEAASCAGFTEHFWRVKQKPGKPLYFAGRDKTLFFGLPGNPVSAYICFCHYMRPLIGVMSGRPWEYKTITGVMTEDISIKGDRPKLLRVNYSSQEGGLPQIQPVGHQGSHMISSIVSANGYIQAEPGRVIKAGSKIEATILP